MEALKIYLLENKFDFSINQIRYLINEFLKEKNLDTREISIENLSFNREEEDSSFKELATKIKKNF